MMIVELSKTLIIISYFILISIRGIFLKKVKIKILIEEVCNSSEDGEKNWNEHIL